MTVSSSQPGDYGVQELDLFDGNGNLIGDSASDGNCSAGNGVISCDDIPNTVTFNYNTATLTDGEQGTLLATAIDQTQGYTPLGLGVDNTPPMITTGGQLAGAGGSNQLTATVTDATSGVQNVKATLDGTAISPSSTSNYPCESTAGTGCSATATWNLGSALSAGWHTLVVNASDWANNLSTVTDNFPVVATPSVSGTLAVGQTVSATPAAIPGTAPQNAQTPVYTYQWMSCGPTGQGCSPISGATGTSYTPSSTDVGSEIELKQTATIPEEGISETATTAPSQLIEPATGPGCTTSWLPSASGTWSTAADWSGGQVPGAADVACVRDGYTITLSASATVSELQAPGAIVSLQGNGITLTLGGSNASSDVGYLGLGNGPNAGSLAVTGALFVGDGLTWTDGSISGGGAVTLGADATSWIQPQHGAVVLNDAALVNKGNLEWDCQGQNDMTHQSDEVEGENGATLQNQNYLSLGTTPAPPLGGTPQPPKNGPPPNGACELAQVAGTASTFENSATLVATSAPGPTLMEVGWQVSNSGPGAIDSNLSLELFGGETAPLDGNWSGSTLALESGGPYSITDDVANFGGASVVVAGTPGGAGGTSTSLASFLAGTTTTAPSLSVANGQWTGGTLTADGPLTVGASGAITTIGTLDEGDSAQVTVNGTVNAAAYNAGGGNTMTIASGAQFIVYGKTGLTGTETVSGSNASLEFEGPVNVASQAQIVATGGVYLGGAVTGTGSLSITAGQGFYEEGGVNITGGLTVQSGSGDIELTSAVTAGGPVSLTTTGRIAGDTSVTAPSITANASGGISLGPNEWSATGAINLQSAGNITIESQAPGSTSIQAHTLNLGGGGTTVLNGTMSVSTLVVDQELLDNEGVLAVATRLLAENGTQLVNDGEINANNAVLAQTPSGPGSQLINDSSGQLIDTSKPTGPTNVVSIPYSGAGTVSSAYIINDAGAAQYGGDNPATPDMVTADCDNATDCGNGDQTEQQTDLTVAGLGGGLALTRSYSSRLAASETSPGMFGYGWTTPFEQRLVVDSANGTATITTATGSTAEFVDTNGTFSGGPGVYSTLTTDSNGDYTYVQPDQTTTLFGPTGIPLSVTNRQGQATTYAYNGKGQLTSVTAPSGAAGTPGRSIIFTYVTSGSGTGLVATASDPAGLTVSYSYDANNNLIGVSDSQGVNTPEGTTGASQQEWTFQYDGDGGVSGNDTTDLHELTLVQDADGNQTTITYQGGYVTSVTDPLGRKETWQYTLVNNGSANVENAESETVQTSPAGNVTTYYMNSLDEPTVTFNTNGSVDQYTYDGNGDVLAETSGNGNTTKYTYDRAGNKLTETDPVGLETKWTYDSSRDILTETLPSGLETSYGYDPGGEPKTVTQTGTDGTSETTTMAYNSYEELTSKTTDLGHETNYTYDPDGDLATETDPLGNATTYGYDADGRQICETTPRITAQGSSCVGANTPPSGAETQTYDLVGDVLSSTSAAGDTSTYTYDPGQRKLTDTDPDKNTTSYTYDADGELTKTTFADNSTQTSTYSPDGNQLTQTNGDSQTYSYSYNSMDEQASSTDPSGHKTTYGYDYDGNLTTIGYPDGQTTGYTYDADDRKIGTSYSDGEPNVSYTYFPDGQVKSMVDGSGTTSYIYDTLDRLTGVSEDGRSVSYGYNADNDQTSIGYPNGQSIGRAFNIDDQPSSVTDWLQNTTTFSYSKDSGLAGITFPTATGETDSYTYNTDDSLTGVTMASSSGNLATTSYTRDPDELITAQSQTGLPGPASETLSYTKTLELSGVTPSGGSAVNYAYDKAKNITELDGSGSNTYTYNNDSELTNSPTGTYQDNTLGERTCWATGSTTCSNPTTGDATYSYDQDQNLTAATTPAGASAAYTYNGDGQLMSSTMGGTTTQFTWDDTATDPALLQAGTESYIFGPDGVAIEQISSSGTVQYLHHDEIGSTRLITNTSGTTVGSLTYNPYGATTGALAGSTGTATSLLGYAGEYTDPTTGLEYDQARWYDPATGQFMVVDPKVQSTWQPYAYASDDPVLATDPSGQDGGPEEEMIGAAAGGADDDPEHQEFDYIDRVASDPNDYGMPWSDVDSPEQALVRADAEAVSTIETYSRLEKVIARLPPGLAARAERAVASFAANMFGHGEPYTASAIEEDVWKSKLSKVAWLGKQLARLAANIAKTRRGLQ